MWAAEEQEAIGASSGMGLFKGMERGAGVKSVLPLTLWGLECTTATDSRGSVTPSKTWIPSSFPSCQSVATIYH